jgi:hypothetical protein
MGQCRILPGPGGITMENNDPLTALEERMDAGETPMSTAAGN